MLDSCLSVDSVFSLAPFMSAAKTLLRQGQSRRSSDILKLAHRKPLFRIVHKRLCNPFDLRTPRRYQFCHAFFGEPLTTQPSLSSGINENITAPGVFDFCFHQIPNSRARSTRYEINKFSVSKFCHYDCVQLPNPNII